MIVDTHCHLDYPDLAGDNYTNLPEILKRAQHAGVERLVTISTHVRKYEAYAEIATRFPNVFFTIGTHPHYAHEEETITCNELVSLAKHPRCIGIGEAGLDYHYDKSPQDIQMRVFRKHIQAARETGLPLIIHARQADDDMMRVLKEEMAQGLFKAVLHCFSSTAQLARVGVELGIYISFSGILTFKRSQELRDIALSIPMNRLLVETDAPYLAPEPHRGKKCEPSYTALTAMTLAHIKDVSATEIAQATTANFYRLFSKAATLDQVTIHDHI